MNIKLVVAIVLTTALHSCSSGPDLALGQKVFTNNCTVCHGLDGKLGVNGSKDLSVSILTKEERVSIIKSGKGVMTPFGGMLKPEEIEAVAAYTMTLKK